MLHYKTIKLLVFSILLFNINAYSQKIDWEKTIGGKENEYLFDVCSTYDNGFILAGSSLSNKSGNKYDKSKGSLDFFISKMNKNGESEWQFSYGGLKDDILVSIQNTNDGGYILGGHSNSPKSGEKSTNTLGKNDIWIIKINPEGIIEWEKTFGGTNEDKLTKIIQTSDGYLILSKSNSNKSLHKKGNCLGSNDVWIIKIDWNGKLIWEKTLGGNNDDSPVDIGFNANKIYVLARTNSKEFNTGISSHLDNNSIWIIELDKDGNILNNILLGGDNNDHPSNLLFYKNTIIITGYSNSQNGDINVNSNNGYDYFVLTLSNMLVKHDIFSFDSGNNDYLISSSIEENGNLIIGGYTMNEENKKNYYYLNTDLNGNENFTNIWKSEGNDILKKIIILRNGDYILAGNSDSKVSKNKSKKYGSNDFWIVKLNAVKEKEITEKLEAIPNPTDNYTNIVINHDYNDGLLSIYDINGRKIHSQKIKYGMIPINLSSYSSGIYIIEVITNVKTLSVKVIKK